LSQIWDSFIGILHSFIGLLSAIIVAVAGKMLYDKWKRPRLDAYPPKSDSAIARHISPPCGFYHIVIKNQLKRLGLMVKPVQNARVKMIFSSKERKEIFCIPAKWDFRPEPLKGYPKGKIEPSLISQAELLDISPGSEESFCVCIKYKGEDVIYGFNAFSYLHRDWKNPNWKLDRGEYYVHVILNAANVDDEFSFLLKNDGPDFGNVKLERIKRTNPAERPYFNCSSKRFL